MTITNQEAASLPLEKFKHHWLNQIENDGFRAAEEQRHNELKDLMACICDACVSYKGLGPCELYGECSRRMAESLMRLGWRRMDATVTEAFNELTRRLKENVTAKNVDHFSEAKCYMLQIENDYVKRCYPSHHERISKGVKR